MVGARGYWWVGSWAQVSVWHPWLCLDPDCSVAESAHEAIARGGAAGKGRSTGPCFPRGISSDCGPAACARRLDNGEDFAQQGEGAEVENK